PSRARPLFPKVSCGRSDDFVRGLQPLVAGRPGLLYLRAAGGRVPSLPAVRGVPVVLPGRREGGGEEEDPLGRGLPAEATAGAGGVRSFKRLGKPKSAPPSCE